MNRIRDPEGIEAKTLIRAGQFSGMSVLEIGCGFGWLTWQFAGSTHRVYGFDPCLPDLHEAKINRPKEATTVYLVQATGEKLPYPTGRFDSAVFSSSL